MLIFFTDRCCAISMWEVVTPISSALIRNGHQVCWVTMCSPKLKDYCNPPEGVEKIIISVNDFSFPAGFILQMFHYAPKLRSLIRDRQPDIVHSHFAVPGIVARIVAKREGCCVVSTQHELFHSMNFVLRLGMRFTERYVDVMTHVSQAVARSYAWPQRKTELAGIIQSPKHVVILNGVDIDKIYSAIAGVSNRIPGRIVCAGRMVPVKRQQLLIEALPSLLKRHPHIKLHLIGSGPMEKVLRHRVDNLGLTNNVVFLGWLSHVEVLREMASAELVVVPSDGSQEGFGLVVAEALVCGTPLLVSDIPVFREVFVGVTKPGSFFAVGDVNALTSALVDFKFTENSIVNNVTSLTPSELERLSAGVMADQYVKLYRRLTTDI